MRETWLYRVRAAPELRERLIAELYSLGTLGIEETDEDLRAYFDAPVERGALGGFTPRVELGDPERVPAVDWERRWRDGLEPRRVGPLWIRPSWCVSPAGPGEPELVIDPQQAFGSGEHATTRLALDLLLERIRNGDRVLDLGTGSGILLLGAQRLGARGGIGFDVEAPACVNARANAARNGLPAALYCGRLDALAPAARFDCAVANVLWHRLEPWVPRLRQHATRVLIVSGFLASERDLVHAGVSDPDWRLVAERSETQTGDEWCAAAWHHTRARQESRISSSVDSNS